MSRRNRRSSKKYAISAAALAAISLAAREASAGSLQVFTQWNFDSVASGANHGPAATLGTGTATVNPGASATYYDCVENSTTIAPEITSGT